MRSFVLDIIVIELCSNIGFPLEVVSEHCWHVLQERVCLSLMEKTEGGA
jgi:hypothetical protein